MLKSAFEQNKTLLKELNTILFISMDVMPIELIKTLALIQRGKANRNNQKELRRCMSHWKFTFKIILQSFHPFDIFKAEKRLE